jgi:hypothetical protein
MAVLCVEERGEQQRAEERLRDRQREVSNKRGESID